ncbi:MAG: hypothetical protein ABI623_11070 [bacterium]
MSYSLAYAGEFRKQVKKYRSLAKTIERKILLLAENPYHNCKSEPLHQKLKGLRSARLTQNIRIIFAICEEAKLYAPTEVLNLCNELGGKAIIFVTVDVHEKAYKR